MNLVGLDAFRFTAQDGFGAPLRFGPPRCISNVWRNVGAGIVERGQEISRDGRAVRRTECLCELENLPNACVCHEEKMRRRGLGVKPLKFTAQLRSYVPTFRIVTLRERTALRNAICDFVEMPTLEYGVHCDPYGM